MSVSDMSDHQDHSGETFTRIEKVKAAVLKVLRQMEANDREVTPFSLKQEFTLSQRHQAVKQYERDKKDKNNLTTNDGSRKGWAIINPRRERRL